MATPLTPDDRPKESDAPAKRPAFQRKLEIFPEPHDASPRAKTPAAAGDAPRAPSGGRPAEGGEPVPPPEDAAIPVWPVGLRAASRIVVRTDGEATTYEVDGRVYRSLDEVPANLRTFVAEIERSQGHLLRNFRVSIVEEGPNRIGVSLVGDREYPDVEDVPGPYRALVRELRRGGPSAEAPGDAQPGGVGGQLRGPGILLGYRVYRSIGELPAEIRSGLTPEAMAALRAAPLLGGPSPVPGALPAAGPGLGRTSALVDAAFWAAYLALGVWAHAMPGGLGSYALVGLFLGDALSWLAFAVRPASTGGGVRFTLSAPGATWVGLAIAIALLLRGGAFDVALEWTGKAWALGAASFCLAFFVRLACRASRQ